MAKLQPGEIVLMHVGSNPVDHSTLDGDSLKTVIDQIKAAGYGFVTVPQGLGLPEPRNNAQPASAGRRGLVVRSIPTMGKSAPDG